MTRRKKLVATVESRFESTVGSSMRKAGGAEFRVSETLRLC